MACRVNPYPRGPLPITIGGRRLRDIALLVLLRLWKGEEGDELRPRGDSGGLSVVTDRYE